MRTVQVPRLIDCHVHFREPGLTHKGNFASESLAAHFGGISVACDMPNTMPPTQTIEALSNKVKAAQSVSGLCDLRFFFGATSMKHLKDLESLWTQSEYHSLRSRCSGLKLYLDNSTGNLRSDESVTSAAFELCGRLGIVVVAHCEDATTNSRCSECIPYTTPASHSERRPAVSEEQSIRDAVALASKYHTKLHIAHLSTSGGLEAVKAARKSGLPITCEVAPHHLFLSTEDYESQSSHVKVNPPMRAVDHRDALWLGLMDGTVDCIGTDHAPHTAEEKAESCNPPSGIPGVELVVPLMLSAIAGRWPHPTSKPPRCWESVKFSVEDLVRWMHTNPNRIFELDVSDDAVTTLDLDCEWRVKASELHSKVRWSPYDGWLLTGKVMVSD